VFDLMQDLAVPDLFVDDDLTLQSDGAVINFGVNAEIQLTHVHDVGLLLTETGGGAPTIQFRDSAISVSSSADATLDLAADGDINLTAGVDINIPANVGLTFGNDAEKIEGDGTDLTIAGNNINLTAVADIVVPANVGITFGTGEKIEGDNTDITITSGADINLTATADINVPSGVGLTFGDDGEKIEGDGTDLTISGNNINLTAVADIVVPANVGITFGTGEKIEGDNTDLTITSGAKINLAATSDVHLANNIGMVFGDSGEKIEGDGTNLAISSSGELDITATTVDIEGALDVSSTYTGGGLMTTGGNIVIPDAGNIGSASDTDAIAIASDGQVTFSQAISGTSATFTTADNTAQLTLVSTDTDANVGPVLDLFRNVTGATNDEIGRIQFTGKNDAGVNHTYANIAANIVDATSSGNTEDGSLVIQTIVAGSVRDRLNILSDQIVINQEGRDLDFRVESDGNANMLFVDGAQDAVLIGHNSSVNFNAESHELQVFDTNFSLASFATYRNGSDGANIALGHSRNATIGSHTVVNDGDQLGAIAFYGSDGTDFEQAARVEAQVDGTPAGDTTDMPGRLVFLTTADGSDSPTERMRIDSSGLVGINNTSPSSQVAGAADLVIGDTSDADSGMTFVTSTSGQGLIHFSDATSGDARFDGFIGYEQNNRALKFGTAQTERMRIDSNGHLAVGFKATIGGGQSTTSPDSVFAVQDSGADVGKVTAVFGADENTNTLSDNTTKETRIGIPHYDTAEEPAALFFASSSSSDNNIIFGGGTSRLNAATTISFRTASNNTTQTGTERMRIDSSGNLLVGKTTIATGTAGIALRSNGEVRGTADGDYAARFSRLSSNGAIVGFEKDGAAAGSIGVAGGSSNEIYIYAESGKGILLNNNGLLAGTSSGGGSDNTTDLGQSDVRFKDLYLSGVNYIGSSSDSDVGIDIKQANLSALITLNGRMNNSGTTTTAIEFKDGSSSTTEGSITVTSSGTTYNTTSDRRLKDNIEPIADGTEKLMAMNPVTHTWIADPEADAVHGFIAQEMQEIVPEAVSGDPDGEEMMSMDYGRITPVLVAALQDAVKEITALKKRVTELESNNG